MSRRALPTVLAVLALTLALAGPAHAAPAGRQTAHAGFWTRALTWLTSLIVPRRVADQLDYGGMIDPNGSH